MKVVLRWSAVLLLLAATSFVPMYANKAASLFKKAAVAEQRQDYEAASELYKQAYAIKPADLRYRLAYLRTKYLAAAVHVQRGRQLRESGKLAEAIAEFESALRIDGASFVAKQELDNTREDLAHKTNQPIAQRPVDARVSRMASPAELKPISTQPISLRMNEDTKVTYETIGKMAGVNVLFDPDFNSKRINIDLNNVTLGEALQVVAMQSKSFWRPVTSNTIYVAADTTSKRKEVEQQAIKTFYLENNAAANDITDITNVLRQVLDIRQLQAMPSQGALVVRGTPDQLAMAEKLINDIDRARPEVVVDIAFLQVNRAKVRNLGLTTPLGNLSTSSVSLQAGTTTSSSSSSTSTTSTSTALSFKDLNSLHPNNFAVSLPSVTLTALFSDSDTRVLENPTIRALDGAKASLKSGKRVPTATGSTGAATGSASTSSYLLSQTSFTYIDVGLLVEVTPKVHANHDISLKLSVEVSSVCDNKSFSGFDEPVICQQKLEQEARLKEGEANILGGLFENNDTKSYDGLPFAGKIPVFKYVFGLQKESDSDSELVIVMTPHIVRSADLDANNTRALDVGTANSLGLRFVASPDEPVTPPIQPGVPVVTPPAAVAPVNVAPAAQQPVAAQQSAPIVVPQAQPAAVQSMSAPNASAPSAANAPALISFDAPVINQTQGATFTVGVSLAGVVDASALTTLLHFDPKYMRLLDVSPGPLLSADGVSAALAHREDAAAGSARVSLIRPPGSKGVSGSGAVFTATFAAIGRGQTSLTLDTTQLRDKNGSSLPLTNAQTLINLR